MRLGALLLALGLPAVAACRADAPVAARGGYREPVPKGRLFAHAERTRDPGRPLPPYTALRPDPGDCARTITAMSYSGRDRTLEVEVRGPEGAISVSEHPLAPGVERSEIDLPGGGRLRMEGGLGRALIHGYSDICIDQERPEEYWPLGPTVPHTAGRLVPPGPSREVAEALMRSIWDEPIPRAHLGVPAGTLLFKLPPLERIEGIREGSLRFLCGEFAYTFIDLAVAHPELREPRLLHLYAIGPLDPERFRGVHGDGHTVTSFLDEEGREVIVDPFTSMVDWVYLSPDAPRLSWPEGYDAVTLIRRSTARTLPPRERWPTEAMVPF